MQASVIDTPAAAAARHQVLPAFVQVALDHHAGDAALAAFDLACDVGRHVDLPAVLLGRVGVRAVDHHLLAQAGLAQHGAGGVDLRGVEVGQPCRRAG
jgi:hypothetical protein